MARNVARTAFDLVLEVAFESVDGQPKYTTFDCAEAVLNFGLNRIPSAHCALASGRNAKTLEDAVIHATSDSFVQNLPARIWLFPNGEWLPREHGQRWSKAGPQIIFDGYIAGLGYRRAQGVMSPVAYLSHWLSDLSYSSSLSDQSHPGNPAQFRWPAASRTGVQTTAPTEFLTNKVSGTLFQAPNIQGDFWARTLHPMFYQFAKNNILWRIGEGACEIVRKTNDDANKALSRIETHVEAKDTVGTPEKGAGSPYHVPLAMKQGGVEARIANAIAKYFRRHTMQYYYNSTTWDKLIEFSAAFKFCIVPRVQTAMMVPFVPGLRSTFKKVLDAKDVTHMESSSASRRPLRAVGVLPGTMQTDVLDLNMRPAQSLSRLGGCWTPGPNATGMIMYVQPPLWLNNVMMDLHEPLTTVFKIPGTSTTTTAALNDAAPANNAAVVESLTSYYNDHARYVFAQEMLRGRYATVQSKLRLDLAPGTNVAFRGSNRLFLKQDKLSEDYVGTITKVGVILNATAPMAATTFQLDYTRTARENEDDRTSIDHHPLYNTTFTGAPLLHDYVFEE